MRLLLRHITSVCRPALWALVAVVLFSLSGCVKSDEPTHEESTYIHIGDTAPEFTTTLLDGSRRTLSSLRGEVIMLIFFSSTCPDCQAQMAEMQRLLASKTPNFHILAISRAQTYEQTSAFKAEYGLSFEIGLDPDRVIYSKYASMYVPRTFVIDQNGKVAELCVEFTPHDLQRVWAKAEALTQQ